MAQSIDKLAPRFQTAMASIKLVADSGLLDLTQEDFDFLITEKCWIATDRQRARRCIEASVYGAIDYLGFPRMAVPAEFIAGCIAYFVHPVNAMTACALMDGAEWSENVIQGVERPVRANELFAFTIRLKGGIDTDAEARLLNIRKRIVEGQL